MLDATDARAAQPVGCFIFGQKHHNRSVRQVFQAAHEILIGGGVAEDVVSGFLEDFHSRRVDRHEVQAYTKPGVVVVRVHAHTERGGVAVLDGALVGATVGKFIKSKLSPASLCTAPLPEPIIVTRSVEMTPLASSSTSIP